MTLRRLLRATFLGAMVAAASWGPQALAGEATELIKKVEAKYKDVSTIQASFTQTTRSELFGDETLKGDLVVKRPAMMRWAFGAEKLFVTDGKRMWIYTAEDKQVIEYDDISSSRSSADALLTSLDKLDEQFDVTVLESGATGHKLKLAPHEEGQFKEVRLELDADLMFKQVVITDTFDNVTEMTFTNVKLNVPTEDSLFTYKAPAGVDVVKATTN